MNYSCVVVAAGKSERFKSGTNKLLYHLSDGKTVLEKALSLFREDEECKELIVVCNDETMEYLQSRPKTEKEFYVYGGDCRSKSVYNGLKETHNSMVMVHDGARCYLLKEDLESLKTCMEHEEAALLTKKEIDTIKEVKDGYVVRSIDRNILNRALTPQAFNKEKLMNAIEMAFENDDFTTDEASAMEKYSTVRIKCVDCIGHNNKVTTLNDIY